ncbi:MAG: hypothetical protein JSW46_06985 [Gemmatimonadota bacterium]|nr:MAG: hypothetical protein JSW46_06985 [Gemmatimonadota bacterium]
MKLSTALQNKRLGVIVAILIVIVLLPFGFSGVRFAFARRDQMPDVFLEMPAADTSCVRDTEYMRFRHMDLLKQIREEFIRDGIRGDESLTNCRDCHTSRERFCSRCHEAASVILDCFGCHYYPEPDSGAGGSDREVDHG